MICDLSILQSLYNLTTVLDPRYIGIPGAPERTGMWGPIFGGYIHPISTLGMRGILGQRLVPMLLSWISGSCDL